MNSTPAETARAWILEAYYKTELGMAATARSRAQGGFALVSLVAGAMLAAVLSSRVGNFEPLVQGAILLALVFWLLSAGFFFAGIVRQDVWPEISKEEIEKAEKLGVTISPSAGGEPVSRLPAEVLEDYALRVVNQRQLDISTRVDNGGLFAFVALGLTFLAAVSILFVPKAENLVSAQVGVGDAFFDDFVNSCLTSPTDDQIEPLLFGRLDPDSLDDDLYVELELPAGVCGADTEVVIPSDEVRSIVLYPECGDLDQELSVHGLSQIGPNLAPGGTLLAVAFLDAPTTAASVESPSTSDADRATTTTDSPTTTAGSTTLSVTSDETSSTTATSTTIASSDPQNQCVFVTGTQSMNLLQKFFDLFRSS